MPLDKKAKHPKKPIAESQQTKKDTTPSPAVKNENGEIEFNDQFLVGTGSQIDVSRFAKGNPTLPGIYKVAVYVNASSKLTTSVEFTNNGTDHAAPCLTSKLLLQLGIDISITATDELPSDRDGAQSECIDLSHEVAQSSVRYDDAEQRLDITIAQIYLSKKPQGYLNPVMWDDGINAAIFSYDINAYRSDNRGQVSENAYVGMNYGFNIGAWRFRARGSLNWDQDRGADYAGQDIYLQRDVLPLKAQMLIGDSYTRGDTFDSISLRGVRLYSDDRMLPGSMSGYAPVVRGIANSNAKVTVRQSDQIIYQTTVPPGAFAIDDLNPTGFGSDLDVTVEEADGSEKHFSVPFSSVAQMLRPGYSRWDIGIGQLNDNTLTDTPYIAVASGYYGISNTFTGYAGLEFMDNSYISALLGLAVNTKVGAFAFDITQSRADIPQQKTYSGQSYRLSYSKRLSATDTSLNVAAYRYSTKNYLSLHDAATLIDKNNHSSDENSAQGMNTFSRMRNQIQINISQPLRGADRDYGSLYTTASWANYWGDDAKNSQYSVGYSGSLRWASYSISLQRSYDEYNQKDDSLYLNISIPLENLWANHQRPAGFNNINVGMNSDLHGIGQLSMSANGATSDNRLNYSLNTSYSAQTQSNDLSQIGGYGSYNSQYGPISGSLSASNDHSRQMSLGTSGGMVIHSGGITFAAGSIGATDTLALIKAPGAKGSKMNSGEGRIDAGGYGIYPNLSAYHENNVGLDISTLESDVEIKSTSATTIPRDGAIVQVDFQTDEGRSVLMNIERTDGGFIPLGADVYNGNNQRVGSVGQAGRAFVRGIDKNGKLHIVWGSGPDKTCQVDYQIADKPRLIGMTIFIDHQQCLFPSINSASHIQGRH
ncbi:outer membrane usher protein [Edaphovirga cremea]|uniref:outer membrane usher protein n=1 Tax=Edaphovirga cremea TaxID=2267246 RepID=UPI0039897AC3